MVNQRAVAKLNDISSFKKNDLPQSPICDFTSFILHINIFRVLMKFLIRIRSDELAKIWKAPSSSELDRYIPQVGIHSFGSSVSTKFIKRPDGSIEEHHTIRDSDGNEEIKVTRKIGDKIHSVITKKTKDGSEIKTEDLFNMDESKFNISQDNSDFSIKIILIYNFFVSIKFQLLGELKDFNEKWIKFRIPQEDRGKSFPWHIFFGPSPKL